MYDYLMLLILFSLGISVTLISIQFIRQMLDNCGLVRQNYRGKMIPVGMGIVFIPPLLLNTIVLLFSNVAPERLIKILVVALGIISMSFVGIIDDAIGNRDVTGMKGHFSNLFKGELTTGAFKALIGGIVGLLISVTISKDISSIILGMLVIALSTNFMNLLDLRPGRAIKVYLFAIILCLFFCSVFERELMMLIVPAVIAYFYYDIKAMAMMGDAGSNVLGISLGIFIVISFNMYVQIFVLILLILVHLVAEKYSITKIIRNNKILNYIDEFGRNKGHDK
ncbi:glycosyl transferase [Peptostreptococcus porci]|uniref:glycosyl transferase n=1 Tax=Peptostreptococcus porci TaxID=2652282 RepID=UPI002A812F09|nr:glycosyl transferase [Peptostreptococcus porci]MDY4128442.1 glycosyl transferase [Peptostreptococcus porci]